MIKMQMDISDAGRASLDTEWAYAESNTISLTIY
jgi:hypothetical protein